MLSLVLLAAGRCAFLSRPDFFVAFPESEREYLFYSLDQECAAKQPQIVIQGTSRLVPLENIPLANKRWHTRDHVVNISARGNTFWHMAALLRRHPDLLDQTELEVVDLIPYQILINANFLETDALFLRESTVREKWLIAEPASRLKALADLAIPVWSQRHSAHNWYRALVERPHTSAERLDCIHRVAFSSLPEVRSVAADFERAEKTGQRLNLEVLFLHRGSAESKVQIHAFNELIARRPPRGSLLLIRPPFRTDFQAKVLSDPNFLSLQRRIHDLAETSRGSGTRVEWYEHPEEIRLTDQDYTEDGVHFTDKGVDAIARRIAQTYRELYPPSR